MIGGLHLLYCYISIVTLHLTCYLIIRYFFSIFDTFAHRLYNDAASSASCLHSADSLAMLFITFFSDEELHAILRRQQPVSTGKKNSRKNPTCRKCGNPRKGHKKGQCLGMNTSSWMDAAINKFLVYTTQGNSAFRVFRLAPQSRNIKYYSSPGGFSGEANWCAKPFLSENKIAICELAIKLVWYILKAIIRLIVVDICLAEATLCE